MGRIKKKQTLIQLKKSKKFCHTGNMHKNLMERYFALKFLNFPKTKKYSTKSFLTFRELQPLISYKRVSYKKIRVYGQNLD